MPSEKKNSKGGFLYLFEWKAKSQKKLFSNKSGSSNGVTNQGKESVDNSRNLRDFEDQSSFRGNGNCSGTSSLNGDEDYGTKAPGLVARLMGLDSMPTTSVDASSVASYYSEDRIMDFNYGSNKLEGFTWGSMDNRSNQTHGSMSKRFQTEILPPKSAKPISITHHKLLSPIKNPGFVPTKDAAYVMEAAARIIESSPHPTSRISSIYSPSSSFRLHDLKEKIDAAQRSSRVLEFSKTPKQSPSVVEKRGNLSEGSRSSRSLFKNSTGSEKVRNKAKPGSVPARDKAKMHRTESREKEAKQVKAKHTRKPDERMTPGVKSSSVLRQNNEKQNNVARRDKSSLKTSFSVQQPRKSAPGDNSSGPSKVVSRVFVNAENGSKKVDQRGRLNGVTDKNTSLNKVKSSSRKNPSVVRENLPDSSNEGSVRYEPSSRQSNSGKDMDVISFTFTSPIKKSGAQSLSPTKAIPRNCHERSSISPTSGLNVSDGGSLNLLLEQKLKELTNKIVSNQSDLMMESFVPESTSSQDTASTTTMDFNQWTNKDQTSRVSRVSKSSRNSEDFENVEEHATTSDGIPECSISGSCVSSSTTSDFTYGYDQPSSPQSQEVTSSLSTESVNGADFTEPTSCWEVEYLRHILHYSGLKTFWFDKHYKTIDPAVFDLLENLINTSSRNPEICTKLDRRILFDCVSETVSSRYERVCIGSHKSWTKWEMLLHNDNSLTEVLFKEILGFQKLGTLMVDEVVDRDMSSKYGKWLDFEIESLEEGIEIEEDILASLIDEIVDDLHG